MPANDLGIYGLPHCWVCERRFTDQNPPGPEAREEHHIIPRQAGGTDGPQVSLCTRHHTALHKICDRLRSGKPFFDLLGAEQRAYHKKIMWLATRASNAFEATDDDPNKLKFTTLTLDQTTIDRINKLKRVYPKAKSREAVYALALDALYRKHFTH